jgi:DNA-binding LacI/PurR family transcriptional regulator
LPGDISVVGFDNTRLAGSASLSLTSVAQDSEALARHAVELAIARAGAPHGDGTEVVVAPRLVIRGTTRTL